MLLNCLRKISEKIIATRLSHFAEHLKLLHNKQIKDTKNRFTVDATYVYYMIFKLRKIPK